MKGVLPAPLQIWSAAVKQWRASSGHKGPIPKKNTDEYNQINAIYNEMKSSSLATASKSSTATVQDQLTDTEPDDEA